MRESSTECEPLRALLTIPTGSIIQAPRVNQLLILKICNSEKDFA